MVKDTGKASDLSNTLKREQSLSSALSTGATSLVSGPRLKLSWPGAVARLFEQAAVRLKVSGVRLTT
jgi:hypothetical protein